MNEREFLLCLAAELNCTVDPDLVSRSHDDRWMMGFTGTVRKAWVMVEPGTLSLICRHGSASFDMADPKSLEQMRDYFHSGDEGTQPLFDFRSTIGLSMRTRQRNWVHR